MQAVVWQGPRRMQIESVPIPTPEEREVLVRVHAVGICGSEISGYLGQNSLRRPPLIMGHEFSGSVVAAPDVTGFAVGDRVTVNPMIPCGACVLCRNGRENLCLNRSLIGAHRPGAFAEYVAVPAKACYALPDTIDDIRGTLVEPTACALRAVELAGVAPASAMLIQGAGPIGLLSLVVALRAGASTVIVSDINPTRLGLACAWGATHGINPAERPLHDTVLALTDGMGVDAAIDAVGLPMTRKDAICAVRPGGRVVFIGLHEDETTVPANHIVRSEITVQGSFCYTQANFTGALRLLAHEFGPLDRSWIAMRPLGDADASFAQLIDNPSAATKIVLQP